MLLHRLENASVNVIKLIPLRFGPAIMSSFWRWLAILFVKVPSTTRWLIAIHQHIQALALPSIEVLHLDCLARPQKRLILIGVTEKLI